MGRRRPRPRRVASPPAGPPPGAAVTVAGPTTPTRESVGGNCEPEILVGPPEGRSDPVKVVEMSAGLVLSADPPMVTESLPSIPDPPGGVTAEELVRSICQHLHQLRALVVVATWRDGSREVLLSTQPVADVALAGLMVSGHALALTQGQAD